MKKQLFGFKSLIVTLLLIIGGLQVQAQHEFAWVKGLGGASGEWARGVTTDAVGNVYMIIGVGQGPIDFNPGGNGGVLSDTRNRVFFAKYDRDGNYIWAKGLTPTNGGHVYDIAVDMEGDVYITGHFFDTLYFEGGGNPQYLRGNYYSGSNVFIAKYDTDGNYVWARDAGSFDNTVQGRGSSNGFGIAVDTYGAVYVTGQFTGTIGFGSGADTLVSMGGTNSRDLFLAKYDTAGNYHWVKAIASGGGHNSGEKLAVDSFGNVYMVGSFASAVDFDPGGNGNNFLVAAGDLDGFIAKYRTDGSYVWAKNIGGPGQDMALGVHNDEKGYVYVTGSFRLTADFNPGGNGRDTLTSVGGDDAFLAKYDTSGNYLWARKMGSLNAPPLPYLPSDQGSGITTDAANNVYTIGTFSSGAADFNPGGAGGSLTAIRVSNVFITKHDEDGNFIWVKSLGGSSTWGGLGSAIALDKSGHVYATGHFVDSFDFNPSGTGGKVYANGFADVFLLKLACNDSSTHYINVTECSDSYTLNGEVYTADGIYLQHLPNSVGCDSIITLELTFDPLEQPIINVDEFVLGTDGTYVTYQWIKNGVDIPGADKSTYTVSENADYQVRVTNENGCESTSGVYEVTNVTSIKTIDQIGSLITVFPNPAEDVIFIQSPVGVNALVMGADGRVLGSYMSAKEINLKGLSAGIYFLRILDEENNLIKVEKIIKQ